MFSIIAPDHPIQSTNLKQSHPSHIRSYRDPSGSRSQLMGHTSHKDHERREGRKDHGSHQRPPRLTILTRTTTPVKKTTTATITVSPWTSSFHIRRFHHTMLSLPVRDVSSLHPQEIDRRKRRKNRKCLEFGQHCCR